MVKVFTIFINTQSNSNNLNISTLMSTYLFDNQMVTNWISKNGTATNKIIMTIN